MSYAYPLLISPCSKGMIRLGDLRSSALCESYSKQFEDTESDIGGFFQELVTTISDVKFSPDGNFIVSRDYLTMKIWDPRVENRPLRIVKFHDHLIPKLCDLYENDSIFDKFECSWNGRSNRLLTGSYNNNFYICDAFGTGITHMTALKPGMSAGYPQGQHLDSSQKVLPSLLLACFSTDPWIGVAHRVAPDPGHHRARCQGLRLSLPPEGRNRGLINPSHRLLRHPHRVFVVLFHLSALSSSTLP